jgi:hypothetical protein
MHHPRLVLLRLFQTIKALEHAAAAKDRFLGRVRGKRGRGNASAVIVAYLRFKGIPT